jgi:hypothetical protein
MESSPRHSYIEIGIQSSMSSVPVFRKVQWPIACQHTCTLSETYLNRAVYKERLEMGTCNLGVTTLVEAREVEYRLLAPQHA